MVLRRRSLEALESRLVWILGSPRTGSTWLLGLLVHPLRPDDEAPLGVTRHNAPEAGEPHAIPLNEPYISHHLAPDLPKAQLLNERLPATTLNELRGGGANYFLADRFAESWLPNLRAVVLERVREQADLVAREHSLRSPLVVIKEPNGSLGAPFVMSLLPRSRLIFLLRDGRDVVDSMLDARRPGAWLGPAADSGHHGHEDLRAELIRREATLWLLRTQAVQKAFDAHAPARRVLVRYEQARNDPRAVLTALERWLGIERSEQSRRDALRWNDFDSFPSEVKGPGKPLRGAQPGLWRQNMSEREQRLLTEILGAKLAELGYRQ